MRVDPARFRYEKKTVTRIKNKIATTTEMKSVRLALRSEFSSCTRLNCRGEITEPALMML